jgi:hypothetical protein
MLLKILPFAVHTHTQFSVSRGFTEQIMLVLRILCYNGSLVTWTVVRLTIAKFKSLISSVSGVSKSQLDSTENTNSNISCIVACVSVVVWFCWRINLFTEPLLSNSHIFWFHNSGSCWQPTRDDSQVHFLFSAEFQHVNEILHGAWEGNKDSIITAHEQS